ncbi:DUF445 domain-containing protein [Blastococcus sp. Marseille-P5729]|uniref:DUF445 domain-containing protein n=1 Tax=Blastococcus sp. Marseille-P5729 TaxID=2086582 RepID=UPI000D0E9C88|nr:DUF445 domain-containing protein [Blastococcus sp. Marseille-P5729]
MSIDVLTRTPTTPESFGGLTDDERRAGLRKMKMVATGLLVFAAIVFVICVIWQRNDAPGWVGYVKATAEASMVGALADWFAVTALFRHPMGIPIPHTAIIPNKKDSLGSSLGEFVQGNFLTGPVLAEKLRQVGVSQKVGEYIGDSENARKLGNNFGHAIEVGAEIMTDDDVQDAFDNIIMKRVRQVDAAPILAKLIDVAVEGGNHQHMMTAALKGISKFMHDNRAVLRLKLAQESPDWVPSFVDDKIFERMFNGVQSFIDDVSNDEQHAMRTQFDVKVREYAEQLRTDPEAAEKIAAIRDDVLNHPAVREWSQGAWTTLKRQIIEMAADPESDLRKSVDSTIMRLGRMLQEDKELQRKADGWIERGVLYIVDQYKDDIADLISGTVARWDTQDTSRKIETLVGRDLQFIRINGTVIGALAGLAIYTISQLIG